MALLQKYKLFLIAPLILLAIFILFRLLKNSNPALSPSPEQAIEEPTNTVSETKVGEKDRTYLLQTPAYSTSDTQTYPLLIVLHGEASNAQDIQDITGMNTYALNNQLFVVYPNGFSHETQFTWNAGFCCGEAKQENIDDVSFISSLIKELSDQFPIDPSRIYLVGFSNGGMLVYKLLNSLPNTFAAAGIVSSALDSETLSALSQNITPIIFFQGTEDQNTPYWGGNISIFESNFTSVSTQQLIDSLGKASSCQNHTNTNIGNGISEIKYTNCDQQVEYTLYKTPSNHSWPGGQKGLTVEDIPTDRIDATNIIVSFLTRFKLFPT